MSSGPIARLSREVRDCFLNTAHMPARGQGSFIGYLLLINTILSSVGFEVKSPNSWYETKEKPDHELHRQPHRRSQRRHLSILVLFAGRNNFLLWLTNWSHSTFLLPHH